MPTAHPADKMPRHRTVNQRKGFMNTNELHTAQEVHAAAEDVEVEGHIIDSLILPKILDCIMTAGGNFQMKRVAIGQTRNDPSYVLLSVQAPTQERLQEILNTIADHGATPVVDRDCRLIEADMDGAFPEGFYSSTNQRTE